MAAKLCPLFVAAQMTPGPDGSEMESHQFLAHNDAVKWAGCIGSRCAAWDSQYSTHDDDPAPPMGRCGMANGRPDSFPDPAADTGTGAARVEETL